MADDLGRWLRAVRPEVPADGGFAESAGGQAALDAIHARTDRDARPAPLRRWRPVLFPAAAIAAVAVTALALTSSGTPAPTGPRQHLAQPSIGPAPFTGARPVAQLLDPYRSCGDLLAGLRTHLAATVGPNGLPGTLNGYYKTLGPETVPAPLAYATSGSPSAPDTSTTNDQEVGADEPDIVKTDGDRVVTVTDGKLRVVDTTTRAVTGTLDLTLYAGWPTAQLLVAGDSALVLLGGDMYYPFGPMIPAGGAVTGPGTTVLFVDLAGQPAVTGSLHTDSGYLDARLVGNTVRIVTESAPDIAMPPTSGTPAQRQARNRGAVAKAPLSAWLPSYSVTSRGTTTDHTVPCTAVSHPKRYSGASLLSIYTLDITHPADDAAPISVAADGDTVYATTTSLYVASTPYYGTADTTQLHRFDITGSGRPTYLGSGSVPGTLVNRYALSEYDGRLRVATTVGRTGAPGGGEHGTSNGVYVLDANTLATEGQVTGLAGGEQIYAVRYAGPLAYVVTFRQTDPLFVVDLADPRHPRVAGRLQLTGYSSYLHDLGDGRLLGVGQQVSGNGVVAGVQVSLFDVSRPDQPRLVSRVAVAGTPNESPLDPHAFLYWPPSGLVAVPLQSWNAQNPGALVLHVSGRSLARRGVVTNPAGGADGGLGVQRSLIVSGALWTLSASGIQVSNPDTLARAAWIAFS